MMREYKVGDQVWWQGSKVVILRVHNHGEIEYTVILDNGSDVCYLKEWELKPIIKVKNGVIYE